MTDESAGQFYKAAERGIAWISAQQRANGSFFSPADGVGGYYKVPYALALAGRQRAALRLLDWVAKHHFTREGDFRGPECKTLEPAHDAWPVYTNAWLVQGACRVGRWDLARRGADFVLRHQTRAGGFYALDGDTRYLEPVCTSWAGLAVLMTGHVDQAVRAGHLLAALAQAQPDPHRFYFRMDTKGRPITDVPDGEELSYFVNARCTKQIYFHPGISLIFLCHLFLATDEDRFLRGAKETFYFTERCADDVHRFPPSGKLGVGAALFYALTGSKPARRAAIRVAEYLVETQTAEGFWTLPDEAVYASIKNKDSREIRLDLTAEFSTFLMEIASWI